MFVVGLIAVNAVVVAILCLAFWKIEAAPMARYRRHREVQHRLDHLHEHPDGATMADIEVLLRHTLPARRAATVCELAAVRGVPTLVLWTWIDLYDAELLALAVESGMSRDEMVHRVATGTAPDRRALEIFASFRGAVAS